MWGVIMNTKLLCSLPLLLAANNAFAVADVPIQSVKLTKKMEKQFTQVGKKISGSGCSFNVLPFKDERFNKSTISWAVNATNVDAWLVDLHKSLIEPVMSETSDKLVIEVSPSLNRLYTYNESMNINGMAVAMADYSIQGDTFKTSHHRGFYSKTNWANGDSEFIESAEKATHEMLLSLLKKLPEVCEQAKSSSSL